MKLDIIGRVTNSEIKTSKKGNQYLDVSVVVNEKMDGLSPFVNCKIFEGDIQKKASLLKKGAGIQVEGELTSVYRNPNTGIINLGMIIGSFRYLPYKKEDEVKTEVEKVESEDKPQDTDIVSKTQVDQEDDSPF